MSYLDNTGLAYFWQKIKTVLYSATNPPPYPVTSVNNQTGDVSLSIPDAVSDLTNDSGFVDATGAAAAAPVQSVNGKTGTAVITSTDVFAEGITILTSDQYGTTLPAAGNAGRIFFLKV